MKFKDYLNSLVSKRKNPTSSSASTKSHSKSINIKNHQESNPISPDSHYDVCGYEDINNIAPDDQHSRTQVLLARHAQLVNNIVGSRTSNENPFSSCSQCRISYHPSPTIPPPPPLPPKLSFEHQTSYSNRNYSTTLATCSPRRECQQQQQQQTQNQLYHQSPHISLQYSTPNPNVMSSSSSSLWTTTTTSLSKKQRSKIRTNPWIGNNSLNNRQSTFMESPNMFHHNHDISPSIAPLSQPEYEIYDPTFHALPSGLIHSESFPQTISNGNIHLINIPPPPPPSSIPAPTPSVILHQSDSGHGFSLSSSRVIESYSSSSSTSSSSPSSSSSPPSNSSPSSPDNTSSNGIGLNTKPQNRQKKLKKKTSSPSPSSFVKRSPKSNTNTEQHCYSNTISSDSGSLTRRKKAHRTSPSVTVQYRYQRPSNLTKATSPIKSSLDRKHQKHSSHSSSSRSIDDHFSLEFEEILENERSYKQLTTNLRSPTSISPRKSPFILPLDDTNMKLSSPPPPIIFSPTLTKTNSRAILKHIEEIENEIRLIKNLDLNHDDDDEYVLSPHAYPEDDIDLVDDNDDDGINNNSNHDPIDDDEEDKQIKDERKAIYDQVDQWVEKCLNTNTSPTLLHNECDHLANTMKDYVVCVYPTNEQQNPSIPIPKAVSPLPEQPTKLMTTFYLSSMPVRTTKRTSSFIDKPLKLENTQTATDQLKSIHECPF